MPVSPSPNFLQQFGMQAPQAPTGPIAQQQLPMAQPLMPSWMRTGFEGGTDALLGMLGIGGGPNASKMNQVGQLGAAAIPMFGSGVGLASRIKPAMQAAPEAGEIENLISQMSNNLRKTPGPNPVYDDAGRFLAMERADDPAYLAHVASSRGKFANQPNAPLTSNYTTPNVPMAPMPPMSMERMIGPQPLGTIDPNPNYVHPTMNKYDKLTKPSNDQLESLMAKYKK